jgi:hypothetical protein
VAARRVLPPWVQHQVRRQLHRFRRGGREGLLWALRMTSAAVAAYLVALLAFGGKPLLAPLTALLVVQATPKSLLASGVDRVLAVVAGVSLAVLFSAVVPLSWWSLGLVIGVSLLIGQVMRLQANLLEVPISGMLVLGVRAAQTGDAAWDRIAETLIGASVGVIATLLLPPKVATESAADAIQHFADELAALLRRAADQVVDTLGRDDRIADYARDWLDDARTLTHSLPSVGAALIHAEEGRTLNVRALRAPNAAPGLRQGLEALEHSGIALRGMFRGVADVTSDPEWPDDDSGDAAAIDLVQVLRELAAGVEAFGALVRAEATSRELSAPERVHGVDEALQGLHDARDRLRSRIRLDSSPVLTELYVSLSSTVKRVLREMDLEERVRRQELLRPPPRRHLAPGTLPKLGDITVAQWVHVRDRSRQRRDANGGDAVAGPGGDPLEGRRAGPPPP